MRHHLQVLEGLFSEAKSREGLEYISALNGQLSELAPEVCCANVTVNALLRSCLGRARAQGCRAQCGRISRRTARWMSWTCA